MLRLSIQIRKLGVNGNSALVNTVNITYEKRNATSSAVSTLNAS